MVRTDVWRIRYYVRTLFFGALLRIFVVSDYICPVFHYGVSAEKNGGTYGRKLRLDESFGHEIAR